MMNVLRGLDRKSYHADFLIFSEGETENSKEAQSYGATIYRLPQRRKGLIYYRTLLRFFRNHKGKYNAVHWNEGEMTTLAPIFFAWKYKVPFFSSEDDINKIFIIDSLDIYATG